MFDENNEEGKGLAVFLLNHHGHDGDGFELFYYKNTRWRLLSRLNLMNSQVISSPKEFMRVYSRRLQRVSMRLQPRFTCIYQWRLR